MRLAESEIVSPKPQRDFRPTVMGMITSCGLLPVQLVERVPGVHVRCLDASRCYVRIMSLDPDVGFDSVEWYNLHAESVVQRHESIRATDANAWLKQELRAPPANALDVGAGAGRDSVWLNSLGYNVLAVEPSPRMAAHAQRLGRSKQIEWIDDRLPYLTKVTARKVKFDLILVSSVWMHVRPNDRVPALAALLHLLSSGGMLAIAFCHGNSSANRPFFECRGEEIIDIATGLGAQLVKYTKGIAAPMSPPWVQILLRRPII